MVSFKHWAVAAGVGLLGIGLAWAGASPPEPAPEQPLPPSVLAGTPLAPLSAPQQLVPPAVEDNPPVGNASHRSANFLVYAPTPTMARVIAAEAEYQRAALARQWLGKELGQWESLCEIRFLAQAGAQGGATTFTFGKNKREDGAQVMTGCRMELRGEFLAVLTNGLPHEVMHTVLANHFGKPLPRWADEGLALCCEGGDSQRDHDTKCRELLNAGRGIRLSKLFRMNDYPKDTMVVYAQGHSVVRFLLTREVTVGPPVLTEIPYLNRLYQNASSPHQQFVLFLHLGMGDNTAESWDKAAKTVYGFESVDRLEETWLDWLKQPPSRMKPLAPTPVPGRPKDEKPDLIPPTNLPGGNGR
jgi:hypothetical protein